MEGSWSSPELPSAATHVAATAAAVPRSTYGWDVRRSLGRCWWSAVLSLGLWTIYWFWTYRKLLDIELGRGRDDATLHTAGIFVPILNYFVIYWLWRDLNELRGRVGLAPFGLALYMVGAIVFSPVAYSFANQKLNEYWEVRSEGFVSDAPTTTGEKAVIGVGAVFFVLYVVLIALSVGLAVTGAGSS